MTPGGQTLAERFGVQQAPAGGQTLAGRFGVDAPAPAPANSAETSSKSAGLGDYLNEAFRSAKNVVGGLEATIPEGIASVMEHGKALGQWLDRTVSGPAQLQMTKRNQARSNAEPQAADLFRQAAEQLRNAGGPQTPGINPIAQKGLDIGTGVAKGAGALAAGGPLGLAAQMGLEREQTAQREAQAEGLPRDVQQARGTAQGLMAAGTGLAFGAIPGGGSLAAKTVGSGVIGVGGQIADNAAARVTGDPNRPLLQGGTEAGLTTAGITALTHAFGGAPEQKAAPDLGPAAAMADALTDIKGSTPKEPTVVNDAGTAAGPVGSLLADQGFQVQEGSSARPDAAQEANRAAIAAAAEQSAKAHFLRNNTLEVMRTNPELQTLALEHQETQDPARKHDIIERLQDESRMFLRSDEIEYLAGERGMPPEMPQGEISPPGIKLSGAAPPAPLADAVAKSLGAEVGRSADEIQAAKPMPPILPEADIPSVKSRAPVFSLLHKWAGDQNAADTYADIQARGHEKELFSIVGKRSPFRYMGDLLRKDPRNQDAVRLAGDINLYIDTYGHANEYYEQTEARLSTAQKAAFDRSQNLSPRTLALAETIRQQNFEQGKLLERTGRHGEQLQPDDEGKGLIAQAKENYTTRIWKPLEDRTAPTTGAKARTNAPQLKQRDYPSILHGWADGRELQVDSAIEAQRIAFKNTNQVINTRQLIDMMTKSGMATTQHSDDVAKIEHDSFVKWTHVDSIPAGSEYSEATPTHSAPGYYRNADGDIFRTEPLYASPDVAQRLNNVIKQSNPLTYPERLNSAAKANIFSYSNFHNANVSFMNLWNAPGHDIPGVAQIEHAIGTGNIFGGAIPSLDALAPVAYMRGKGEMARGGEHVDGLLRNAIDLKATPDMLVRDQGNQRYVSDWLDKHNVATPIRNLALNLRQEMSNWTFHGYIPALKLHMGLLKFRQAMADPSVIDGIAKGTTTVEKQYEAAAMFANDVFTGPNLKVHGQLPLSEIGSNKLGEFNPRSPTAIRWTHGIVQAPAWTESNMQLISRALSNGETGVAYRQGLGSVAVRASIVAQAFNLAMAAIPSPDDPKGSTILGRYGKGLVDRGALGIDDLDITQPARFFGYKDPERVFLSALGPYKDVAHLVYSQNPETKEMEFLNARGVMGKMSWAAKGAISIFKGTNEVGAPFTSAAELTGQDEGHTYKTFGKGHVPGQNTGGNLIGQTNSFKSAEKPGPIGARQFPSWAAGEVASALPIPAQSAISLAQGRMATFLMLGRIAGANIYKEPKQRKGK